jgi:hypothetical protein
MDLTEAFLPDKPVRGVLFHCVFFENAMRPFALFYAAGQLHKDYFRDTVLLQARKEPPVCDEKNGGWI